MVPSPQCEGSLTPFVRPRDVFGNHTFARIEPVMKARLVEWFLHDIASCRMRPRAGSGAGIRTPPPGVSTLKLGPQGMDTRRGGDHPRKMRPYKLLAIGLEPARHGEATHESRPNGPDSVCESGQCGTETQTRKHRPLSQLKPDSALMEKAPAKQGLGDIGINSRDCCAMATLKRTGSFAQSRRRTMERLRYGPAKTVFVRHSANLIQRGSSNGAAQSSAVWKVYKALGIAESVAANASTHLAPRSGES